MCLKRFFLGGEIEPMLFLPERTLRTAALTCILCARGKWSSPFSSKRQSTTSTATNSM